jgi:glutamate 5-kinase
MMLNRCIGNNSYRIPVSSPSKTASGKKKWIAHSEKSATGSVLINAGAKALLIQQSHQPIAHWYSWRNNRL